MSARGTQNKKKQAFREALRKYGEKVGVDPHFWMYDLMKRKGVRLDLKFQAAKELAQYLEPKLRSMQVSGDTENPLMVIQQMTTAQLDARIAQLTKKFAAVTNGHEVRDGDDDTG